MLNIANIALRHCLGTWDLFQMNCTMPLFNDLSIKAATEDAVDFII